MFGRRRSRACGGRISFVSQDTFLFSGTVRENIALGSPGATEDDIVSAAKAANASEFIAALPKQFDTAVGENGASLSGGQRQRIAIARAVLKDAPNSDPGRSHLCARHGVGTASADGSQEADDRKNDDHHRTPSVDDHEG